MKNLLLIIRTHLSEWHYLLYPARTECGFDMNSHHYYYRIHYKTVLLTVQRERLVPYSHKEKHYLFHLTSPERCSEFDGIQLRKVCFCTVEAYSPV